MNHSVREGKFLIIMFKINRNGIKRTLICALFAACVILSFNSCGGGKKDTDDEEVSSLIDTTSPVVSASDFEVTVGDSVSYKKHIEVSDDFDSAPDVIIDSSQVDLYTPGQYTVTYTVSDSAGNQTVSQITLTVKEKVYDFDEDADAYLSHEARKILADITHEDMNDMQKAYAIYNWTKYHIGYASTSDKTDYKVGARDGFMYRSGDCFTYYSVAKVLLDEAGIPNIDMVKLRTRETQARHYWSLINVGDGWYHFDATQYVYKNSNFFMVTDEELKDWDSRYYKNCHNYDPDGLPELATKSVQHMINYGSSKLVLD